MFISCFCFPSRSLRASLACSTLIRFSSPCFDAAETSRRKLHNVELDGNRYRVINRSGVRLEVQVCRAGKALEMNRFSTRSSAEVSSNKFALNNALSAQDFFLSDIPMIAT